MKSDTVFFTPIYIAKIIVIFNDPLNGTTKKATETMKCTLNVSKKTNI